MSREIQRHIGGTRRGRLNPDQFQDISRRLDAEGLKCTPIIKGKVGSEDEISFTTVFNGIKLEWRNNKCVDTVKIYVDTSQDIDESDYIGSIRGEAFFFKADPGTWYFKLIPVNAAGVEGTEMRGSTTASPDMGFSCRTQNVGPSADDTYDCGSPSTGYRDIHLRRDLVFNAASDCRLHFNATTKAIEVITLGQVAGYWLAGTYFGETAAT